MYAQTLRTDRHKSAAMYATLTSRSSAGISIGLDSVSDTGTSAETPGPLERVPAI
jgi:hypothetical protein